MITLRLDPKLEELVVRVAKDRGLTKSEFIRQSIKKHIGEISDQSAWELGQDIFGRCSSGRSNLSVDRKRLVKETIKGKRR